MARVEEGIAHGKTRVIDVHLAAYFDTVRHDLLLGKVARRIQDDEILHLLKLLLKASGKRGVRARRAACDPVARDAAISKPMAMLDYLTIECAL